MLHALIMAGGGGTRFWPRSRARRPKQFLTLTGDRSLLQLAFDRIEATVSAERTWIFTGQQHLAEARRQLPSLPEDHIVGEPCLRDTAGCIALAAALIAREDPSATMLVTPADHLIEPAESFRRALHFATQLAEEHPGALFTFGITPTFPATGYGYIHRGTELASRSSMTAYRVRQFCEKPKADRAEQFFASGEYFWNAGIFLWKVQTILHHIAERQPTIHTAITRIASAWSAPERVAVFHREFAAMPRISIDYAVMEQAPEVVVVQAPFSWDDVGSWLALERIHPQDADGNTIMARHSGLNTKCCIVVGDGNHLITTVDVQNLLIVQDGSVVLVADKSKEGSIKQLVEQLGKQKLEEHL